jgi:hypothetical protein
MVYDQMCIRVTTYVSWEVAYRLWQNVAEVFMLHHHLLSRFSHDLFQEHKINSRENLFTAKNLRAVLIYLLTQLSLRLLQQFIDGSKSSCLEPVTTNFHTSSVHKHHDTFCSSNILGFLWIFERRRHQIVRLLYCDDIIIGVLPLDYRFSSAFYFSR